jgi:hypothetical protein
MRIGVRRKIILNVLTEEPSKCTVYIVQCIIRPATFLPSQNDSATNVSRYRYQALQTRLDLYNSELALASSPVLF